jgi:hypothetical protein
MLALNRLHFCKNEGRTKEYTRIDTIHNFMSVIM